MAQRDEPEEIKCSWCGKTAIQDASQYTLIGDHGWRIVRKSVGGVGEGSKLSLRWCCPECWKTVKDVKSA